MYDTIMITIRYLHFTWLKNNEYHSQSSLKKKLYSKHTAQKFFLIFFILFFLAKI